MTNAAYRRAQLESLVEAQGGCRATPPLLLKADPYFDLAGEEFGRRLLLTTDLTGADPFIQADQMSCRAPRVACGSPSALAKPHPVRPTRSEVVPCGSQTAQIGLPTAR